MVSCPRRCFGLPHEGQSVCRAGDVGTTAPACILLPVPLDCVRNRNKGGGKRSFTSWLQVFVWRRGGHVQRSLGVERSFRIIA